ncbi:hypothetical protein FSP39_024297 [Pinctada imbricata]|uniref:DUF1279 domain-containing protein n=1 Tax=Pinctada imbricata TaxID=66713 RepID=A0AA88XST7_PINIB|nr:hypothetical protein FSP39_024297 [Pinctada imbricata]
MLNAVRYRNNSYLLYQSRACNNQSRDDSENRKFSRVLDVSIEQSAVSDVVDYQIHGPSAVGVQGGHDHLLDVIDNSSDGKPEEIPVSNEQAESYNCNNNVNLHGCMQTNVPEPFNTDFNHSDHYNMPGGGGKLFEKYIQDVQSSNHQSKYYHTSSRLLSAQAALKPQYEEYELAPQGVQGDDCVNLKLWMENCQRYGLPNCEEQLTNLVEGRKTLAEVFREQEDIIQMVAESYKRKRETKRENSINDSIQGVQDVRYDSQVNMADSGVQGVQGIADLRPYHLTSPQGIQGDECVQFKLWLENCNRFGLRVECEDQLVAIESGRKTLAQIFTEQDLLIRKVVQDYKSRRHYSTSSGRDSEVGKSDNTSASSQNPKDEEGNEKSTAHLSQRERLKLAVRDYGSTVIVFHITISLASLGLFYLAVSSGIDVVAILSKLGVGESILQSRLAAGTSTFVIAYAVHKVFAPVRIGITLTATPFIVRYLRQIGFLKVKSKTKTDVNKS